jgi:hypothetical protein
MSPCLCVLYFMKKIIKQYLEANDLDAIVSLAKKNRKVLSLLVRSAYDKEALAGWRAIKAVGLVAQALVNTDYGFLRETVRKLLWSLSDESGGIGWSAPEILGEIVAVDPQRFSDIIPLIAEVYYIEEDVFRPGVVYALGRIAEISPGLVLPHGDIIVKALSGTDPLARGYAIRAVKSLWNIESQENREVLKKLMKDLLSDNSEIYIYHKEGYSRIEVGEEASIFLSEFGKVG